MSQTRTFQMRLPRGPHEAVLETWAALAGEVMRDIHSWMRVAHQEAATLPAAEQAAFLREAANVIKSITLKVFGLTGRQYNGLHAQLMGLWESRRELAKHDVERLAERLAGKRRQIARLEKRLAADRRARAGAAARGQKGPTEAQAKAMLSAVERDKLRFARHQGKRKLESLAHALAAARDAARSTAIPAIVFGGGALLRERARIHANDKAGLAAWRDRWDSARAAGFMLIGGADEACGNKSCKASLDAAGRIRLDLRLPPALVADATPEDGPAAASRTLSIAGIALPAFGAATIREAVRRNQQASGRIALTFRFVRDRDFRHETLSAWRVCVTIKESLPAPRPAERWLGLDINADHIAAALVSADGNPLETYRFPLPLRGKSSNQRRAIIEAAAVEAVALAERLEATIVLEALDFTKKKRELADARNRETDAGRRRARMLSSFAYARIRTAIVRRAEREGVATRAVSPAYTSLIGEVNFARRYGLTRHQAAAVAIARRAAGFSERINYLHGHRGRRNALPAPEEARRHVWRQWSRVHRERTASARAARRESPAHPPGRGGGPPRRPGPEGRITRSSGPRPPAGPALAQNRRKPALPSCRSEGGGDIDPAGRLLPFV